MVGGRRSPATRSVSSERLGLDDQPIGADRVAHGVESVRIKRARQLIDSGGAIVFIRVRTLGIELRDDIRQLDGRLTGKTVGLLLKRVHVVQRPRAVSIDWVGQDQSKPHHGIAILVRGQFARDIDDANRTERRVRLELRADLGDFAGRLRARLVSSCRNALLSSSHVQPGLRPGGVHPPGGRRGAGSTGTVCLVGSGRSVVNGTGTSSPGPSGASRFVRRDRAGERRVLRDAAIPSPQEPPWVVARVVDFSPQARRSALEGAGLVAATDGRRTMEVRHCRRSSATHLAADQSPRELVPVGQAMGARGAGDRDASDAAQRQRQRD